MQHNSKRPANHRLLQHGQRVGDAVPCVHNQRQRVRLGQTDMPFEKFPLEFARRILAIPVEASFTNGGHPAGSHQSLDAIPLIGIDFVHVVGMNPRSSYQPTLAARQNRRGLAVGGPSADDRHAGHARLAGSAQHFWQVVAVAHRIQMAVAVKVFHWRSASAGQRSLLSSGCSYTHACVQPLTLPHAFMHADGPAVVRARRCGRALCRGPRGPVPATADQRRWSSRDSR